MFCACCVQAFACIIQQSPQLVSLCADPLKFIFRGRDPFVEARDMIHSFDLSLNRSVDLFLRFERLQ